MHIELARTGLTPMCAPEADRVKETMERDPPLEQLPAAHLDPADAAAVTEAGASGIVAHATGLVVGGERAMPGSLMDVDPPLVEVSLDAVPTAAAESLRQQALPQTATMADVDMGGDQVTIDGQEGIPVANDFGAGMAADDAAALAVTVTPELVSLSRVDLVWSSYQLLRFSVTQVCQAFTASSFDHIIILLLLSHTSIADG